MADFDGAVVLVTGAARGIGRAIALHFAQAGADVAGNDLDADGLESLQAEVESLGRRAIGVTGDVASEAEATSIVERTCHELGRLDILVNNAGIWIIKSLEETSVEEWDLQISTNLRSLFLLTRRAAPAMRAVGGGSIVNLASMAASRFTVPHVAYASSKAGVVAFTRDMAVELAPDRIRVNAVAPGPIDTRGLMEGLTEEERAKSTEKFLLGRMGTPDDIARAVAFLAGPDASYITGVTLPVTGGAELSIRPVM
jgi:3-oxoacyl-[acyl-carrier protein] reductase